MHGFKKERDWKSVVKYLSQEIRERKANQTKERSNDKL